MKKFFYQTTLFTTALFLTLALGTKTSRGQNVGIGTATPLEKLHIIGNVRSSTLSGIDNRIVLSDPNGTLINATDVTSPAWLTKGNTGTTAGTNFIGTNDAVDFVVKTGGIERLRVLSTGNIGIGTITPLTRLHVEVASGSAIRGTQTGFGSGYLGYSGSISLGAFGTTPGAVVFSEEGVATDNPSLVAVTRTPAIYAANIGYSNVWTAGYFGTDNATDIYNPTALYGQLNVTNSNLGGIQRAVFGSMNRGSLAGNPGYSIGVLGIANSQYQDSYGLMGQTFCNNATNYNAGGYFASNNYSGTNFTYAYVATAGNRKIIGAGTVSEIIPTENHGRITLTCPESPEYWYQDYGTVELVNGQAHIDLDPILADIIFVNNEYPIRAFFTPVDMLNFNGVTMINRTAEGFDIVELNGGTNSGTLEYNLVVKPKTNYGEGRFMQAPGPSGLKPDQEPAKAKAKNQPDPSKIWRWPSDNVVYEYIIPKEESQKVIKNETRK